jgi:hypothetical protein
MQSGSHGRQPTGKFSWGSRDRALESRIWFHVKQVEGTSTAGAISLARIDFAMIRVYRIDSRLSWDEKSRGGPRWASLYSPTGAC